MTDLEEEKKSESVMVKLSRFIVDKRKAFFLVFIIAAVFCASSISKVKVNDDITTYLPDTTETRRGLTIMDEEFVTYGTARVMLSNITYDQARNVADTLELIDGVTEVAFDDTEDHYQNASALFDVTFDGEAGDPAAIAAGISACEALFAMLDDELAKMPWLSGEQFGLGDIAVAPFVYNLLSILDSWQPRPHLQRWYQQISQRPAWREVVQIPVT